MNTDTKMEMPFTGLYYIFDARGLFHCKSCHSALFHSDHKFHSGSGWPCFDKPLENAVTIMNTSAPGSIVHCHYCDAFIGQLFEGEGFTPENMRYNISSDALLFIPLH